MRSRHPYCSIVGGLIATLVMVASGAAAAQTPEWDGPAEHRAAIERLVDDWYVEQCAGLDGRTHRLMAPAGFDASPGIRFRDTGAASLGPAYPASLAATTPLFRYEIARVRGDDRFARVQVRERGYRYASAASVTYEQMHETLLVIEHRDDLGDWRVLVHRSDPIGFPPSLATTPLPDLAPDTDSDEPVAFDPRCGRFRADEFQSTGASST